VRDPLGESTEVSSRRATVGLFAVILLVVLAAVLRPSIRMTVLIAFGLVLTIMLHEAGHLIGAKRGGMKATEFFLGFGPRLWSIRRGETEYGIKAIPAGGYVRVIGMNNLEDVEPEDEARTYRAAPYGRRIVMILAGVTVNLILAFLLTFTFLVGHGPQRITNDVGSVLAGSPAAEAGIRVDDRIVAIDGRRITDWEQVAPAVRSGGGAIEVTVERDGATRTVTLTPTVVDGVRRMGVTAGVASEPVPPLQAVPRTFSVLWTGTQQTVNGIGQLFTPNGVTQYSRTVANPDANGTGGTYSDDTRPRSVIGIVADGDDIIGNSFWGLLALLGAINLFLALFNLIPLLPFDGGHAVVATYEAIASRVSGRAVRVDHRRLMPITAAVVGVLLLLGISTMYLDVRGIIQGG
jgi:membrane-associated protease RseP (regulator of RpoE activity)